MTVTDQTRIDQGSSTDVAAIQAELTRPGLPCPTPLYAYASQIAQFGQQYNVDPAFFLAATDEENWYGTYPTSGAWDCTTLTGTYNWASISNAAYGGVPVPGSRWGQYPDILTGIEAFFKLITTEYYPLGQNTLGSVWWGIDGHCPPCDPCVNGACPGQQVCDASLGLCSGAHAYGPCFENPCGNFYDLSDVSSVLSTMTRLNVGTNVCPPGYTYDPSSGGCILDQTPPTTSPMINAVAALAGVGVILAGGYALWRSL